MTKPLKKTTGCIVQLVGWESEIAATLKTRYTDTVAGFKYCHGFVKGLPKGLYRVAQIVISDVWCIGYFRSSKEMTHK